MLSKAKPGHNIYKIKPEDNFCKTIQYSQRFTFPIFLLKHWKKIGELVYNYIVLE